MVDFNRAYNPFSPSVPSTTGTLKRRIPRAYAIPTPTGAPLAIILIEVLSPTSIRVTFNQDVMNDIALVTAANYVISPTLAVTAAVRLGTTQVVLTIGDQLTGQLYTLTAYRIDASAATLLQGTWIGAGSAPTIVSAVMISDSVLRVTWSEPMAPGSIGSVSGYSIAPAVGSVVAVIASLALGDPVNPTYADLVIASEVTIGVGNYTLTTPPGATDQVGNALSGGNTIAFNGRATAPVVLYASTNEADLGHLRVAFSKAVKQVNAANANDALNPANYTISGAPVVSVTGVSPSIVRLAVTGQRIGVHTLTVVNVQDLANNPIPT